MISSLDDFIIKCEDADTILISLSALSLPAFFDRSIYGAPVSAYDAIETVKSLKRLAIDLKNYEMIARIFDVVDPRKLPSAPPDDGEYEENSIVLTNVEREYQSICTEMRAWKSSKEPATERMHKNFYQLIHIVQEFSCLADETESLSELCKAGSGVLSNPTSLRKGRKFDDCYRCILDLYRSEYGKIRSAGIKGGIAFKDVKLRYYERSARKLAPHLFRGSGGLEAGEGGQQQTDPVVEGDTDECTVCYALLWIAQIIKQYGSDDEIKKMANAIAKYCDEQGTPQDLYKYTKKKLPNPHADKTSPHIASIIDYLKLMSTFCSDE